MEPDTTCLNATCRGTVWGDVTTPTHHAKPRLTCAANSQTLHFSIHITYVLCQSTAQNTHLPQRHQFGKGIRVLARLCATRLHPQLMVPRDPHHAAEAAHQHLQGSTCGCSRVRHIACVQHHHGNDFENAVGILFYLDHERVVCMSHVVDLRFDNGPNCTDSSYQLEHRSHPTTTQVPPLPPSLLPTPPPTPHLPPAARPA
jgi:hypothetical protein